MRFVAGVAMGFFCCMLLLSCAGGTGSAGAGSAGDGEMAAPAAAAGQAPEMQAVAEHDPMSANGACYVCHMLFVREKISRIHLAAGVPCVRCHGTSAGHANDEDIGATPPDRTFRRGEVNAACRECHGSHDVRPEEVVARWASRRDREADGTVCTDCHGSHRISAAPSE